VRPLFYILFSAHFAFAAPNPEPSSAVIQEARRFMVAKNRKAATGKLITYLKSDKSAGKGRGKVMESLKTLSEAFFTDQGQRLFETGQSLAFENPELALTSFKEALNLEDANVTVLIAIVRLQLSKKDCMSAEQNLKSAEGINPYNDEIQFFRAKTLLCLKKPKEALALLKTETTEDPVIGVTVANAMFDNGSVTEAAAMLQRALSKDSSYPEVHYWIWKTAEEKSETTDEQGQKYVALCKNLNLRTRRKYINEPRLCSQTQEVEDALKSSPKSTEN
jgi:predicted Zn-dependent protease